MRTGKNWVNKIYKLVCVFFFFFQNGYLARLKEIRDTLEISPFFKTHEVKTHFQWWKLLLCWSLHCCCTWWCYCKTYINLTIYMSFINSSAKSLLKLLFTKKLCEKDVCVIIILWRQICENCYSYQLVCEKVLIDACSFSALFPCFHYHCGEMILSNGM